MRCFFDTNILVYMFDKRAPAKAAVVERILSEHASQGDAVISVQVLQEFYSAATRKLKVPLTHDAAMTALSEFADLDVVEPDAELVMDAARTSHRYRLAIWDSLIIQAALRGRAEVLYSEDLQNGQAFESLTVRNPFAA